MKTTTVLLLISFLMLVNVPLYSQEAIAGLTSGPEKGSLFLAGGGSLSSSLVERFIELAGGVDAPMVVIPTAAGRESYSDRVGDFLTSQGATRVTILHTADREIANSASFRPQLLGIAIDEGTALVVKGDQFEVLGKSYVIIYDGSFWSREGSNLKKLPNEDKLFYFLRDGDNYHLKKREVMKKIDGMLNEY